jgi:hypothetical protein
MFGSSFNLAAAGLGDLPSDILVPGVAVFSRRALPLAAWTNGLEISGAAECMSIWKVLQSVRTRPVVLCRAAERHTTAVL